MNFSIPKFLFIKYNEGIRFVNNLIKELSCSLTFKRILHGSFWNALLNLWGKGISFVGTVIIIRIIGRAAFGEFGMLNTTVAMFGMFTTFGVSQTSTKFVAEFRKNDKEKAGRIIGLSFVFSALLGALLFVSVFIFAEIIAVESLNAPHLTNSIRLMAIGLFFGSINGAQNGIITGFESFKLNTLVSMFLTTILTMLKVALAYFYGFKGAVLGMTIEPIIAYLITYFLINSILKLNQIEPRFKGIIKELPSFLSYSIPSLLVGLLIFPTNWFVMTLLAKTPKGYHELGAFNAANQWFNVLIFIPYILVSTFLPVFCNLLAENKFKGVIRIINNAVLGIVVIFIPLSLLFFLIGDSLALIVYGPDYEGIGLLLAIAVFTLLPQGIAIVFSNLIGALGKVWFSFWVNAGACAVLIGTTYVFLPMGAVGLLYAKLIAFTFNCIVMYLFYINWVKNIKLFGNDFNENK
jgi:O-antigen/teichoic acid export membrane protein